MVRARAPRSLREEVIRRECAQGLVWYAFTGPGPRFRHACLTRLGGVSRGPFASLNLGSTVGDDPAAVRENVRRVRRCFGLTPTQVVSPHQVHGRAVARVTAQDGGRVIPATDALITDAPGLALLLRFADCTPVLFYDAEHAAVGLAHAGWRGVAAGVVPATVTAMRRAFGTRPARLWVGIGPAISVRHYAVGPEVVEAVREAVPPGALIAERREGQWFLDMPAAIAAQLRHLGVQQVAFSHLCTASRTDEWYSHRAEGGRTGRFGVLVMLAEGEASVLPVVE